MQRVVLAALATGALVLPAFAGPLSLDPASYGGPARAAAMPAPPPAAPEAAPEPEPARYAYSGQSSMGGGFIEFIFGGGAPPRHYQSAPQAQPAYPAYPAQPVYARTEPAEHSDPARPAMDPRYLRQVVDYDGNEKPGTIVIDTPRRFLYLVQEGGRALRYGIGVGRPGFTWAGVKTVSAKKEWPDWVPPPEMLKRRPDLPHFMAGGPDNPLGARALYLGSSLYRIHGSNEPWTIGQAVSSGCIRMRNEDVVDLYQRVRVGTKVVVI